MRRSFSCRPFLLLVILCLALVCPATLTSGQQKRVAVTIDDLPLNGPPLEIGRLRKMTDKILAAVTKYQIPAVGFVNESLLYVPGETDGRIDILKMWIAAGVELGNHTFSHLGFKDAALARYEDDFIRGDTVLRMLTKQNGHRLRYFRHPYLQMGPTADIEKTFENFIAERGYRIAPVSIDTLDWMILAAYEKAKKEGDNKMMEQVSKEYLRFVDLKFDYCERFAAQVFERPIDHILLLHCNELNADNLDALMRVIQKRGYQFVALDEVLKDPVYRFPDDHYSPTSDILLNWSLSRQKTYSPPMPPDFIRKIYEQDQK